MAWSRTFEDFLFAVAQLRLGITIFPLEGGRWQVSTKNDDGSFRVHYGATLTEALEKAVPELDDFSDLI